MINAFISIGNIFNRLLVREKNPINQARIKMLAYILVLYTIFTATLIVAYILGGETLHLIRVSIIFAASPLLIAIAYYTYAWKIVSHIVLGLITLAIWSNLTIYVQGVNIETLQFIWLACVLGFYMHGLKWGWFYAVINILPVLLYTATDYKTYFYLTSGPHKVSQLTYLFVITYNFFLILFLHHYFFQAFNQNFITLTETKNELKELNEKLKNTLYEVGKLSNARMDFLSTMSHELRTPLNGVIGISNALLLQSPREDQKENIAVLKFSAENLLSLINDILDFNKFESGKVELENIPFDLVVLIKNNILSIKPRAQEKMLDLNLIYPEELGQIRVISDPTRLTQVLLNLLNNAVKFTEKGTVELALVIIKQVDGEVSVRFKVTDTGIGIAAEKQQEIFEPFIQASSTTNRYFGGTGLGLPIVKKVLTMFNTSIQINSTPDQGTQFYFDIDFISQPASKFVLPEHTATGEELAGLKVLVVEDNPVNVLVIRKTLEQWNIQPVIAENGLIALKLLETMDFDIVLMDLYMPEMDGYEATTCIRSLKDPIKSAVPIIALTASSNIDITDKVIQAGMNDYLSKPFNPDHLYQKLTRLIRPKGTVKIPLPDKSHGLKTSL
ncbi:hypothetical protein N180_10245 [Pedobacter antarcticus 4BY]|uniref:histidine kinase n=2 Tax=Pedobacter antarcticus TaxID=34086 RepID=A0A081PI00_9SPHI|nr:response regulator [Pedobacter antarcticus]KEQ30323.1 hypothetical protein N180_10245 [Pedobacter antarcticus 4BY]SFE33131.1 Signal transduction histidine kinase [Pedobacter antarcticus]